MSAVDLEDFLTGKVQQMRFAGFCGWKFQIGTGRVKEILQLAGTPLCWSANEQTSARNDLSQRQLVQRKELGRRFERFRGNGNSYG